MDISEKALKELRGIVDREMGGQVSRSISPQRKLRRGVNLGADAGSSGLGELWTLVTWAYNLSGWLALILGAWLLLGGNPFGLFLAAWALKWAFIKSLFGRKEDDGDN